MVGMFGITIGARLKNIVMYSENEDTIEITKDSKKWYCIGGLVGFAAKGSSSKSRPPNAGAKISTLVCASNSDCSWVKSYKAKSGKEVAGFCRKKPARTSSQPKQPDKS